MNAPANIDRTEVVSGGIFVPFPEHIGIREDGETERAHRKAISIHCPNQDELAMACRVDIAMMRDTASAGMGRCGEDAYGILAQVARSATTGVYAQASNKQLILLRCALRQAIEAARMLERVSRNGQ